jgi:CHASE2 domain-containing sensor protein
LYIHTSAFFDILAGSFVPAPLIRADHWRTAVTLVVALVSGYLIEEHRSEFPWLVQWQLRCAALLSTLDIGLTDITGTAIVEIDDTTFYKRLGGVLPTNRAFLAKIARIAAGQKPGDPVAAVIAIDIMMLSLDDKSGDYDHPSDDASRLKDNQEFFDAVREITGKGIPVVLASSLRDHGTKQDPNVFDDSAWPRKTYVGYINLPDDHRQIPLETTAAKWNGVNSMLASFALQTALGFDERRVVQPVTQTNSTLQSAIRNHQFVYGGFRKQKDFPHVSASDVADRNPAVLQKIDQKIVFIGSTWSESGIGRGETVDLHDTPFGRMSGVYLHANYLEAMLSGRVKRPLSGWQAALIDLAIGVLLIVSFKRAQRGWGRATVLGVFFVPIILAYVMFINAGVYLDFILPLMLLFGHLLFELKEEKGGKGDHRLEETN